VLSSYDPLTPFLYLFIFDILENSLRFNNIEIFYRILIVDWDVHHGQATQQMFYNDPRLVILYFLSDVFIQY
jgi:hypothetical protein